MCVLGLAFGASLREAQAAPVETKRLVGQAFRGLLAGTMFSVGAVLALGTSTTPANAATLWTTLSGDLATNYLEIWTEASPNNLNTRVFLKFLGSDPDEILTNVFFEFDGTSAPSAINHANNGVEPNSTTAGNDCCTVLGNKWDGNINFAPPEKNGATFFTTGLISNYVFRGILPDDFLTAVAHVQRVGANNQLSEWLGENGTPPPIPLPPAAFLFLTGLAGMGLLARRRRAKIGGAAA